MNVAIITDSFPPMMDGVSKCALGYAQTLTARNDCTCIVVTPQVPKAEYDYPFPVYDFPSIGLPYAEYRAGHPFIPHLAAKLKKMNIEILHVHSPFTAMTIARQLRYYLKIPIVFTQHTKWDFDIERAVPSKILQKNILRYAYGNIAAVDEVWAVSRGAGEYLTERGFKGDYVVMPNGTDFIQSVVNPTDLAELDAKFDLSSDIPTMLFVGRMMMYKGIGLIIDALEILRNRGFEFRMIFVGDGEDLEKARQLVTRKSLEKFIHFAGRINDREVLKAYYTRAELFLFPSVYDTAGLVVTEAAACYCPTVVVRESAASETLEDGVTGFHIDETAESLANCVQNIFADRANLEKVAQNAANEVYLPWSKTIARSVEQYEVVKKNYDEKRKIRS